MLGWFITQKQITETEIGIWEEGAAITKTEDICNRGRAGAQPLLRGCYRQTLSARSAARLLEVLLCQWSAWQWPLWQRVRGRPWPSPQGPPGPPTSGWWVSWGPGDRLGACVLQSSRALAMATQWLGPGLEAVANLSSIPSSET